MPNNEGGRLFSTPVVALSGDDLVSTPGLGRASIRCILCCLGSGQKGEESCEAVSWRSEVTGARTSAHSQFFKSYETISVELGN